MSRGTRRRGALHHALAPAVLLSASLLLPAAACSSSPPPRPRPANTFLQEAQYGIAIAQCAINHGLIPARYLESGNGASRWLHDGHVMPNAYFGDWWNENMAVITVAGKTLEEWRDDAFRQQRLPVPVCGTTAVPTPPAA
jgi:hypothetical protein